LSRGTVSDKLHAVGGYAGGARVVRHAARGREAFEGDGLESGRSGGSPIGKAAVGGDGGGIGRRERQQYSGQENGQTEPQLHISPRSRLLKWSSASGPRLLSLNCELLLQAATCDFRNMATLRSVLPMCLVSQSLRN